jgi:hypothetical protein
MIDAAGADSGRQLLLLRRLRAEVVAHTTHNLPKILAIRSARSAMTMVRLDKDRKIEEKLRAKRRRTRQKISRNHFIKICTCLQRVERGLGQVKEV